MTQYPSINNPENKLEDKENWMGDEDQPLNGFSWKSDTVRHTNGCVFWSDVFLHTMDETGAKVAIVLMDTQGLFDQETSPTENSRIFALGTLISSVQVLNLTGIIQEDHLQYLHYASEFAKLAAQDMDEKVDSKEDLKVFQNMMFLIR